MRAFVMTFGLLASVSALAAPVYLDCKVQSGSTETLWNVALDESAGTASYAIQKPAFTGKFPAVFTAEKVVFNDITVNRTDLSITVPIALLSRVDRGTCEVVKAPARKF